MDFHSIKTRLLATWAVGQDSESCTNDEDAMAKSILSSMNLTVSDSDFQVTLTELSSTFKDVLPDHIKIEFPRPIAVDSDKFSSLRKTAIIKRIKQLSGLKVSIENKDQMLAKIKNNVPMDPKNYKRKFLLKVIVHFTADDFESLFGPPQSDNNESQ